MFIFFLCILVTQSEALQIVGGTVLTGDGGRPAGRTVVIWRADNFSDNKTVVANSVGQYAINCGSPGGFKNPCVHGDTVWGRVVFNGTYSSLSKSVVINNLDGSPTSDVLNHTLKIARQPKTRIIFPLNGTYDFIFSATINATLKNNSVFSTVNVTYTFINGTGNYTGGGVPGFGYLAPRDGGRPQTGTHNWTVVYNASKLKPMNYTLCVAGFNEFWQKNVTCIRVGTTNFSADFEIKDSYIRYTPTTVVENSVLTLNVTVKNLKPSFAKNVQIQFWNSSYKNRLYTNGTLLGTKTINLSGNSQVQVFYNYSPKNIGRRSIYAVADPPIASGGWYPERNETNNLGYINITVPLFHYVVGNLSGRLMLSDQNNFTIIAWNASGTNSSNLYFTCLLCSINFNSLLALGRNKTTSNYEFRQFQYFDSAINATPFNDSINRTFTKAGNPRSTTSFYVFGTQITNVPIVNSTNNTNFVTGILWDTSDSSDNSYDASTKEDIVFITAVNERKRGKYGVYDFEIRIPALMRRYKTSPTANYPVVVYTEIR
jgi:hypothetical protein